MLSLELPKHSTNQQTTAFNRILLVEDEELIRDMIVLALEGEGYQVVSAVDGRKALDLLQSPEITTGELNFDLMILDLMLPYVNGLDICRVLRHNGNTIPIIILSAKGSEEDRIAGLQIGADDYLSKPFSMGELIARCGAMIRRYRYGAVFPSSARQFGEITIFPQECRVLVRDQEVNLSPKEFKLLELFMSYPRRVWSREQLIEQIWEPDFLGDTKTVDVHVRWLREKLEQNPSQPEYLITVRGFGYRFG